MVLADLTRVTLKKEGRVEIARVLDYIKQILEAILYTRS